MFEMTVKSQNKLFIFIYLMSFFQQAYYFMPKVLINVLVRTARYNH